MVWTAPSVVRVAEPVVGDERAMLEGFLDWNRATLINKCAGLLPEQLARLAVPPSHLSLLGIVRHLAAGERNWFRRRFLGENVDSLWGPPGSDAAFEEAAAERAESDVATLLREQDICRCAVAGASLDATFVSARWGEMSLRWIYLQLIAEYSHHNGHADLLREQIDGSVG